MDSQKEGCEIPNVATIFFEEPTNYLRLQNRISILLVNSMDTHLQEEKIRNGMEWQRTAKCEKKRRLYDVVPVIQIQHCPKQLCTCTVTTEASEQFCY